MRRKWNLETFSYIKLPHGEKNAIDESAYNESNELSWEKVTVEKDYDPASTSNEI